MRDLAYLHGDYFIFADKVYDINKLITNHPGGFDVINHARGREVDRFLYGSEPIDSVGKTKIHSHSASSIRLANAPIGILYNVSPYLNMVDINKVFIKKLSQPCKPKYIYIVYLALASTSSTFTFKGYEDLAQLGKCQAVTINNKKTRLYSSVNFLQKSNLDLMELVFSNSLEPTAPTSYTYISGEEANTDRPTSKDSLTSTTSHIAIPLLIKKYVKGSFTSDFLTTHRYSKSIKISKPRGRGFGLSELPNGGIVLLAGGTGLNPFCDIIDLLFK
jgi:hypothetical protein